MKYIVAKNSHPVVQFLLVLQIAVAIFYGGSIFFVSYGKNIMNPEIPMLLKIFKDVCWVITIGMVFYFTVCLRRVQLSFSMVLYVLFALCLACLMVVISVAKFNITFQHLGILKNYALYYFGGGILVLLADHYGLQLKLFKIYRFCIVLCVLIGITLYFIPGQGLFNYTMDGRMISTLANPNYLGYLCAMHLMIICGMFYHKGNLTRIEMLEFLIINVGLIASGSVAGVLTYVFSLFLFAFVIQIRIFPYNRKMVHFLSLNIISIVAIGVALSIVAIKYYEAIPFLRSFAKTAFVLGLSDVITSSSVSVRLESIKVVISALFYSPTATFFGASGLQYYTEMDSSFMNLILNYGLIVFFLWLSIFLLPIFLTFSNKKRLKRRFDQQACFVFSLSIFLLSSVITHFWLQYAPEKYPTCFFIGWIMAFIIHTISRTNLHNVDSTCEVRSQTMER